MFLMSLWLFAPAAILLTVLPHLPTTGWKIRFVDRHERLLDAAWIFAVLWIAFALAATYGRNRVREAWWWLSVPYTIVFPCAVLVSGRSWYLAHFFSNLFLLSWITSASSALWTLVDVSRFAVTRTVPLTKKTVVMLGLGLVASLWLTQALGLWS